MNEKVIISNEIMNSLLKINPLTSSLTPLGLLDLIIYGDVSATLNNWFLNEAKFSPTVKQVAFIRFMYMGVNDFEVVENVES